MTEGVRSAASFRDPSGFVFRRDGILYRQINGRYASDWKRLLSSGLHDALVASGRLIPAQIVALEFAFDDGAVEVIRPEPLGFLSYPYEWSFSQLKDAAILTLEVAEAALAQDMILKDASAYNVQFHRGKPVLIDTLSFTEYHEGEAWIAYRQFCQHFLAPLALMAYVDVRLAGLLRVYIDGIPVDLASNLLPGVTKLKPGLLTHLHLHAKASRQVADEKAKAPSATKISRTALRALLDSLKDTVNGLTWKPPKTDWGDYYSNTNYAEGAMGEKHRLVAEYLDAIDPKPASVWDLGANTGEFSRLAAQRGIPTVAWDIDPVAVDRGYQWVRQSGEANLLPLLQDLTNPSPDQGWAGAERDSLATRGPAGALMALALIHHLAIGNNVPLPQLARDLAPLGSWLILEFAPKEDSQVVRMLSTREDIFPDYHLEGVLTAFAPYFEVVRQSPIAGTVRTLLLLRRKN